jgi:hypothetical protein
MLYQVYSTKCFGKTEVALRHAGKPQFFLNDFDIRKQTYKNEFAALLTPSPNSEIMVRFFTKELD